MIIDYGYWPLLSIGTDHTIINHHYSLLHYGKPTWKCRIQQHPIEIPRFIDSLPLKSIKSHSFPINTCWLTPGTSRGSQSQLDDSDSREFLLPRASPPRLSAFWAASQMTAASLDGPGGGELVLRELLMNHGEFFGLATVMVGHGY